MKCLSEVVAVDPSILARVCQDLSFEDFEFAMPRLHSNFSLSIVLSSVLFMSSWNLYSYFVYEYSYYEALYQLLLILQSDMQRGVHGRLMDNSTSVREAAVELLGRFVLSRPQLTEQYYDMLIERILVRVYHTSCEKIFRICHKHNLIYMFQEKFLLLNSILLKKRKMSFSKSHLWNHFAGKSKGSCGVIQGSVSKV